MTKIIYLLALLFLLPIPNLAQQGEPLHLASVSFQQAKRPVLIGKEDNIVLAIDLNMAGNRGKISLQELILSTAGTTDLRDIRSISVFYSRDSVAFSKDFRFDMAQAPESLLAFQGELRLDPDHNRLWVVCELNARADLDHHIQIACHSMHFSDGQTYRPANSTRIAPLRIGRALLQHGQNGVHTYRIPGLVTTNHGTLIAVYDIRRNSSTDLQEDIDVGMNRSTDGGQTWEPMTIIMDMGMWGGKPEIENGIGDPSVLVDRATNTIWVAGIWAHGHPGKRNWFASQPGIKPDKTSQFVVVKSEDDGLTWSEPINLTAQLKDPSWHLLLQGPGKGISMRDGTLVFPAQFKDAQEVPHSTLVYSKDHGKTWAIGTGAKSHTTESQVVELGDGTLMLNMRDDRGRTNPNGGTRSVVITSDMGQTWTEHPSSAKALVEPVCMASLIRTPYKGKDVLLFSNPAVPKGPRRHITLKASMDEGMTWPETHHLLLNEDSCYGYSCLTRIDEETIGILYEGAGDLYFQRISILELFGKGFPNESQK